MSHLKNTLTVIATKANVFPQTIWMFNMNNNMTVVEFEHCDEVLAW